MRKRLLIYVVLFALSIPGFYCQHPHKDNIIIDLQPFKGISDKERDYVYGELQKVYPYVHLKDPIAIPASAYYAERNRYKADSLIHFLETNTSTDHITIGITNKDISTRKDSIADWGIMGLGLCPGRVCIASDFRLSGVQRADQLFKVAIHELGHTQGLKHCAVKTCFMRDAEGKNTTSEETGFCESCRSYLIRKGWKL